MYKLHINHFWTVEYLDEEGKQIQMTFLKYRNAKKLFESISDDANSEACLKVKCFEDYVTCEVTEEEYETTL